MTATPSAMTLDCIANDSDFGCPSFWIACRRAEHILIVCVMVACGSVSATLSNANRLQRLRVAIWRSPWLTFILSFIVDTVLISYGDDGRPGDRCSHRSRRQLVRYFFITASLSVVFLDAAAKGNVRPRCCDCGVILRCCYCVECPRCFGHGELMQMFIEVPRMLRPR